MSVDSDVVVIVQARAGSTRLPGKVLADIGGKPMLARVIERARLIPGVASVIVATTTHPRDAAVQELARALGVAVVAGSEEDVLDRYYQACRSLSVRAVVRVTADCPLLDPNVSARVVEHFVEWDLDYVSNCHPPTFPDGLDTEVFTKAALERAWREADLRSDREHVTPFLWRQPGVFRVANVANAVDLSALRWTVDDERDLQFIRHVYARLTPIHGDVFGMDAVLALLKNEPELAVPNAATPRNQGYLISQTGETR